MKLNSILVHYKHPNWSIHDEIFIVGHLRAGGPPSCMNFKTLLLLVEVHIYIDCPFPLILPHGSVHLHRNFNHLSTHTIHSIILHPKTSQYNHLNFGNVIHYGGMYRKKFWKTRTIHAPRVRHCSDRHGNWRNLQGRLIFESSIFFDFYPESRHDGNNFIRW